MDDFLNKHDLALINQSLTTDCFHCMPGGQDIHGPERLKAQVGPTRSSVVSLMTRSSRTGLNTICWDCLNRWAPSR
jgi:hypothetical protein